MADGPRTVPTEADVATFVAAVEPAGRRADAERLLDLYAQVTGVQPRMWGPTMIGYGSYDYRYASGREGSSLAAGFSPRKAATTIYLPDGCETYAELLGRLGPHKVGKGCLYVGRLEAVDTDVLREILRRSWEAVTTAGFAQVEPS